MNESVHNAFNPEAAARELIRLCKLEMETTGQPHAYTGTVNNAFRWGGNSTVASYAAGRDYAIVQGWLKINSGGTRFILTPDSEDA